MSVMSPGQHCCPNTQSLLTGLLLLFRAIDLVFLTNLMNVKKWNSSDNSFARLQLTLCTEDYLEMTHTIGFATEPLHDLSDPGSNAY